MEDVSRHLSPDPGDDKRRVFQQFAAGDSPLVVIADDDEDILELLTEVVSEEGFRVCPCADSRAAATALASTPPDLLITDVLLRGDAPLGLLRRLVESGGRLPPVIVLTGIPEQVLATHAALLEQAAAYVESKPFDLNNLLHLVHSLTQWPG